MMQDGEPRHFRYTVQSKNTSTVLTPKKLDANLDRTNLRGTMFGAAFEGCYDKVPRTDVGRIVWEVGCSSLSFSVCFIAGKWYVMFDSLCFYCYVCYGQ